jgi:hypothetical protein
MKRYKIKPTKKQLKIIKLYWNMFKAEETAFWGKIEELERKMSKETSIKDLEFFWSDNRCAGIGNIDRTMGLIHGEEL